MITSNETSQKYGTKQQQYQDYQTKYKYNEDDNKTNNNCSNKTDQNGFQKNVACSGSGGQIPEEELDIRFYMDIESALQRESRNNSSTSTEKMNNRTKAATTTTSSMIKTKNQAATCFGPKQQQQHTSSSSKASKPQPPPK